MRRRRFLDTVGTAGLVGFAGCSGESSEEGATAVRTDTAGTTRTTDTTDTTGTQRGTTPSADTEPGNADFLWAQQGLWSNERVRENLFAFAARHGLTVVIAKGDAGVEDAPTIENLLAAAERHGADAWLDIGVLERLTATEFVNDAEKRSHHLDGIEAVAEAYSSFAPEGRIVLWEEAPVGGRWIESGAWNGRSVSKLERLGPEIFAAQKRRVTDVAPGVDVGIFVHFPYLVDGKQPATFRTLVEELRSRNALPDFTFADFYRGWYAKDAGPGPASAAIRSLVTNAREATGGRPVTYLGQAHTINPQYTPSRQAMWMDLRAALEAGAEAVGWYARKPYKETKQGFDPLLPNAGPAARDGSAANTLTFARDRYQYAYAALRAKRDANCGPGKRATSGDRFDLWLAGRDFDFYDHRLSLRTRGGEWAFVGDFNGYLDGEYPYGDGSAHVSIFRGLSRSRFAPEGDLELAIDTDPESDGARLDGILAMPEDVSTYRTEPEATELYAERSDIHEFSLGHERTDARLTANDSRQFGVELCDPERPLDELVFPGHRAQREQLRAFESRDGFDPGELFDLWLLTDERTEREAGSAIERLSLAGDAKRRPLDEASTAVSTADGGAIYYGIDRGSLARRDGSAAVELAGDGREAVASAYAMPYAGTVAFRPAAEAVELVRDDRASARTFAIAHEEK